MNSCRSFVRWVLSRLGGSACTVPVPTTRYRAEVIPRYLGLYWRCEIRSTTNSELAWRGFGFTKADAVRQAYAWATARL